MDLLLFTLAAACFAIAATLAAYLRATRQDTDRHDERWERLAFFTPLIVDYPDDDSYWQRPA
jgi:hypothetical protein